LRADVELLEALGSEVLVHFTVPAQPAMTDDVKELATELEQAEAAGNATMLARLNPRTAVRKGESVELVVDTARMHFFDADTGAGIYA
jgi:multiple sugar transport system ATP-binding protein